MKLNQGNWGATKTTMGAEDDQLGVIVVSMSRYVLKFNHAKILILLIMIQITNSNLLGLESIIVTNIIIGVYYGNPQNNSNNIFLDNVKPTFILTNIDNIYINTYDKTIHSVNFLDNVTNDMPELWIIEDTYKVTKNRKVRVRGMQQFEKDKFLKDPEELKSLDLLQYKDCNIMYNKFNEKYLQIIDKNISYKLLLKKKQNLSKHLAYLR